MHIYFLYVFIDEVHVALRVASYRLNHASSFGRASALVKAHAIRSDYLGNGRKALIAIAMNGGRADQRVEPKLEGTINYGDSFGPSVVASGPWCWSAQHWANRAEIAMRRRCIARKVR